MNKPIPKDLAIDYIEGCYVIEIFVSTLDARRWIDKEAPAFGILYRFVNGYNSTILLVDKTYNPKEVVDYLLSYGENNE